MESNKNRKFQVGMFVTVALVILAFGIIKLGDVSFRRTYSLYIYFNDIAGLTEKSPIKIAGVEVGQVEAISLDNGRGARVKVSIYRDVPVYRDARARIGSTGIIGTKFLEMTQGSQAAGKLQDGDTINGISSLSMEDSIAKALETVRELAESVKGPNNDFGRNLNQMLANLNATSLSIREILDHRKQDISIALASMRNVMERMDRIMAKIEKGEGAVGALLADPETEKNIKATAVSVKDASAGAAELFGRFNRIRAFWDYRFRYDTVAEQGRSDFGLKVSMRPTRYYFLGASNIGDEKAALKPKDFEEKNTFNLGAGKEFFPWLNLYAGLIRSEGGGGAIVSPFYKLPWLSRVEFQGEAYAFGRDTVFNGRRLEGAVVNAGVGIHIFPWLKLEGRGEDLGETKHTYGGFRINLEDKDIAYFLGLVGTTR